MEVSTEVYQVPAAAPPPPEVPIEATPVAFPEVTKLRDCTYLECTQGHRYPPMVALAKCGYGTPQGWNGCGAPILAIKMTQCPMCNEPTAKLKLRIDHTPPTPFPVPLCIPGSASQAETIDIEIPFRHYKTAEAQADKDRPIVQHS